MGATARGGTAARGKIERREDTERGKETEGREGRQRREGRNNREEAEGQDVDSTEIFKQAIEFGFSGLDNWVVGNSGQLRRSNSHRLQYAQLTLVGFMGNSSSTYIANRLNPTADTLDWHKHPHYRDTSWIRHSLGHETPPLPPIEIAQRLYRDQHAYIGTIFSFLDESQFNQRLERAYEGLPDPNNIDECLVYCQILLVFAFGQMYSINQWVDKEGPPGFAYFKYALAFLPNVYEDSSILFIEVLSYVAYFMQTINRRDSAYLLIGISLRMAISLGLHQEISDKDIDNDTREHRRRLWWSTYSMERLLCVTSGHPISIQDEDVDLLLPSPRAQEDAHIASVLTSYTELSRIQGIIGEKIYRKKQKSGSDLSASVQSIMRRLSDWLEKLPEAVKSNAPDLSQQPSREIVSTYLHYYHCINMTARPILLYAIQQKLASNTQQPDTDRREQGLSTDIIHVINTAISAARSSASILNTAAKYNLVATYGFIDGEQAFSAALLLVMVNIAFPYKETNASAMNMALSVLQGMAERGNGYIKACHSLLMKIKSTIKPLDGHGPLGLHAQTQMIGAPQSTTLSQTESLAPWHPNNQDQPFTMDFEGDSAVWAEVLESIDIDMDRQWVETVLKRGENS
ncbi:fungal-specific transcription factor domain-containing protein [Penicillium atrosanguineum]|uniref:Fungal-specific transcription factor domain-containing protein n=1 Tax=Penicillium atrosanguineum TaxID=1132637 RepID=A0A9W9GLN8_9EURO|nr:fungal-specific transcription factor domain-containing protein [Penicillium atrosanguineum]KAJ5320725.1 fungal-specific transcription factor domain-containing protein [Penicillium atrosanguineum]